MGNACKHRGPEQEGFYVDDFVSLGCERLKIQDLSEIAKQPIHNEDKTVWVILNGEIYNFKELRQKLEENHKFYTESDTEVIVHAYEEFGEDCLQKLDGMFAFAIWDTVRKKLFIARDRLGVKPLFYCLKSNKLLFASEIKSILQDFDIQRKLNYDALCQFVTYAYTIDGQTMFNGVNELLPGHKLIFTFLDKKVKIEKYWDLQLTDNLQSDEENLRMLRLLLENAINKRRVSDAPLGALLSGGLDSSVMVALLAKLSDKPVRTFTTGFGNELDEFDEAKIVAEHCGTDHKEIMIDYSELINSLPSILWHMEFPYGRPSIMSNFMVSNAIKKYVTVAYTGEGSDELFGGYNRYLIFTKNSSKQNLDEKIESISSGFFSNKKTREEIFSDKVLKNYEGKTHPSKAFSEFIIKNKKYGLLNTALLFELKTEIPGAQTWRIDRTGSAHAVELREPFLDHHLVEFCASLPEKLKINFDNSISKKYILQKLAKEILPEKIAQRKKFPWGMPFYDFFNAEFMPVAKQFIEKSIKNRRPYLNVNKIDLEKVSNKIIRYSVTRNKEKEIDDHILRQTLFLFNLELWYQIFIERDNMKNPNLALNSFV
jgi:asparagine synthase (glutamine-hydrolysing)